MLLPPVFVLAWSGLRAGQEREASTAGGPRSIGVGLFLGFAALFYTLLLAYAAFTLALMALVVAVGPTHAGTRCCGCVVIAVIAGAIALIGWAPYLLAAPAGRTRRQAGPPSTTCRSTAPS